MKIEQNTQIKTLYTTDDRYTIWVKSIPSSITVINVTDNELSLTYYVADFDGSKYDIKNKNIFNNIFIRSAKKRPQLVRDLMKFHNENVNNIKTFNSMKHHTNCFKRKVNIYTKKTINKVKNKLSV